MTVKTIETAIKLIDEMKGFGEPAGSVWQYTNSMNNKEMFAIFPARQHCDIHGSPCVKNPVQIWGAGQWLPPFDHLN
ncbi:hypothetical protein LCGC14_3068790 [marine sediment metagenome]|uniref:Uncharacterized protein n=1 Tax=marine sediment metagenome TaxID=412755 RepID=A0A0F8X523_9ZZZZ